MASASSSSRLSRNQINRYRVRNRATTANLLSLILVVRLDVEHEGHLSKPCNRTLSRRWVNATWLPIRKRAKNLLEKGYPTSTIKAGSTIGTNSTDQMW